MIVSSNNSKSCKFTFKKPYQIKHSIDEGFSWYTEKLFMFAVTLIGFHYIQNTQFSNISLNISLNR